MNEIIREAEEELEQERIMAFWKDNARTIITFVVLTVFMTGALSAYRTWDASTKKTQTTQTLDIINGNDFPNAVDLEALNVRSNLQGITAITTAGALLNDGKTDEAKVLYKEIMANKKFPNDTRDLASISAARLKVEGAKERLSDVAKNTKSPFRAVALMEMAAQNAATGDFDTARENLSDVQKMEGLPPSIYQRANALDQAYMAKAQVQ